MESKICIKCNEEKELSLFSKDKNRKDGLQPYCKDCDRAYRKSNRKQILDKASIYRAAQHNKIMAYREENREKIYNQQKRTPKGRYASYKHGAKARGLSFDLSFEEFCSFWQVDCSYCGDPIPTIGLDRVDSSKGYELGNVVSCCTMCNRMKLDHSFEQWQTHMIKALRFQGVI